MKKVLSLLTAFSILLCTLFAFSFNAYANSLKTAQTVYLGQSYSADISCTDESSVNYWLRFDCTASGYYEMISTSATAPLGDVFVTVYDVNNNIVDSNAFSSNTATTVTELTAGMTYYYKFEITDSSCTINATLNYHTHNFSNVSTVIPIADDDTENSLDGYIKTYCSVCGAENTAASTVYSAPVSVVLSSSKVKYNSNQQTVGVTVYDRLGKVVSPSEYTVTYEDNVKPGRAWVYVDFNGVNYKGQLTSSFVIVPKKQTASTLKSKKTKQLTFTWVKDTTVSGYEIQYSTSKKFSKSKTKTITITKNSTKSKTIKNLTKNKKYYVRIRAYKTIDSVKYYGSWSNKLSAKTK